MRILIAEDERITRRSLQRKLERWGHVVDAEEDGAAAWEAFQHQQYDIVVTDWDMPRMDGCEFVKHIRGSDRASYAYIIMLTGRTEKHDLVTGMEAGADDFLAKPFDRDELRVRLSAGERIIKLERRLAEQNEMLHAANDRMLRDLQSAANMQRSLLPPPMPQLGHFNFAWRYFPCAALGGDLLNVIPVDSQHLVLYVADVSGHGVSASLLSVALHRSLTLRPGQQTLIAGPGADPAVFELNSPSSVLEQLNQLFPMTGTGGHFITAMYGIVDLNSGLLRYSIAGHPGPILVREGKVPVTVETPALPIGILDDPGYEELEIQILPGDRLFIYSDGLIEAQDHEMQLYGGERLQTSFGQGSRNELLPAIDATLEDISRWQARDEFVDDMTVLALEMTAD